MFLHRIHLDPRCREARRDLSDPYQLHSTLCRAFCEPAENALQANSCGGLSPKLILTGARAFLCKAGRCRTGQLSA